MSNLVTTLLRTLQWPLISLKLKALVTSLLFYLISLPLSLLLVPLQPSCHFFPSNILGTVLRDIYI